MPRAATGCSPTRRGRWNSPRTWSRARSCPTRRGRRRRSRASCGGRCCASRSPSRCGSTSRRSKTSVVVLVQLAAWRPAPGGTPGSRLFSWTTYAFVLWNIGTTLILLGVATIVHAQPGAPGAPAGARRRRVRQRARGRRLPAGRRPRGEAGGARLPRHEEPHPAADRPAHRHAGRRLPRPADAAYPDEAAARTDAGRRGGDGAARTTSTTWSGCWRATSPSPAARATEKPRAARPRRVLLAEVVRQARRRRCRGRTGDRRRSARCRCAPMPSGALSPTLSTTRCALPIT